MKAYGFFDLKKEINSLGTKHLKEFGTDFTYSYELDVIRIARELKDFNQDDPKKCMEFLVKKIGQFPCQHKLLNSIISLVNRYLPERYQLTAPRRSYSIFQEYEHIKKIQSLKRELMKYIKHTFSVKMPPISWVIKNDHL